METEKLAVIVLAIIIVAGLSAVIISNEDILDMFKGEEKEAETVGDGIIAIGDCVDVYFTERFASNNTVISTNIESVAIEAGIYDAENTYEPAQVFMDPNYELITPPEGYENYSSWLYLPKFVEALEGLKDGQTKTITLESEDAYGDWNESLADSYFDYMVSLTYPDPRARNLPQEISPTMPKTYFSDMLGQITEDYNISTIFEGLTLDYLNGTLQNGENTTWQIEITNTRALPIDVEVTRGFGTAYWTLQTQMPYQKHDATHVRVEMQLQPQSKELLSYTVTTYYGRRQEQVGQ